MEYLFRENKLYGTLSKQTITKETPKYYVIGNLKVPKNTLNVRSDSYSSTRYFLETDELAIAKYKEQTITSNFRKKLSELLSIKDINLMIELYHAITDVEKEYKEL